MNAVLKAYSLSECMEVMAEYAHAYEQVGGKNLIFCEDRLTLIAERALLRATGGTFLSAVSTFARFLKTDGKAISKQGSVMAVGEVMTRLQREEKLQCFTTLAGIGNNARCIYETLAQFSASEITPEILRESANLLPEDTLRRKLEDLALIYEGYADFLRENAFLDESKYLSLLPKRIREEGLLKGYNVFFLGYGSLTAQARETVRAALETADNVIGIFCAGEEELYANKGAESFERVCREYGKTEIRNCGIPLDGDAEILRKGLFNPLRPNLKTPTDRIEIFEAEDKTAEAEFTAVKIRRFMQENEGARYRDIAVLLPGVDGYSLALKKAFAEYKIPYFIDEKRSLKSHPLSRFVLDCFRTVRERFSPAAVQALTQNLFFGESDEYRNYLLKFANYRGGATRAIKTGAAVEIFSRERLEAGREKLLTATKNIRLRGKGKSYCDAVQRLLTDFNVEEQLKILADGVEDVAQKGYLEQIYRALQNVLLEAELLTGEKTMSVAEFETVLKDGLDASEISLIPLKADAVFIGDITDSRIEKVRVLFAMGMTDEVPRCGADTAIVSDKEIARLSEVKAILEPTVAEVNLRARECVCLNLCTFSDKLYLTYPLSADGSDPSVSDVFRYVDRTFCEESGGKLLRRKHYDVEDFRYRCSSLSPAFRQYLIERGEFELRRKDTRKEYASLHEALDKLGVQANEDYFKKSEGQVCIERGETLFFRDGKISPTSLESYFSCPFRHFVERGLRLKEREETAVLAVDTGNFIHDLLERTMVKAAEINTDDEMRAYAAAVGEELLKDSLYALQQDTDTGLYFSEKLVKEGTDVAVAAYRQIKNSDFTVEKTESAVTAPEFYGKVDRVDGTEKFVRVIDYKTGHIDDSAAAYYTGRKLQMQLYMSELKGERVPAGVFYFPASVGYTDEDEGRFRMKGFLNGERDALLCGDKNLTEEKKSEYFAAALKNGASAKKVMDEETFRNFLDYAVFVARKGAAELKEGYIAPTPYEGGCEYCKYGGMCGFDKESCVPRKEGHIDPKTIAEIARKQREGSES
ncbi:MAG: PD-(D/E)XK nuclease family protein [Clostridia bacterium]|nr:PD-(D/E)XK nuclease family protein [Clostridia bacterium]